MIKVFANANYDFLSYRKIAVILTALFVIPGLIWIAIAGLNYSIEFTGGTVVQVRATSDSIDVADVRAALGTTRLASAEINEFGARNEFVVRARLGETGDTTEAGAQRVADEVTQSLERTFGPGSFTLQRREAVGPKVGACCRSSPRWSTWRSGSSGASASRPSSPRATTSSRPSPSCGTSISRCRWSWSRPS
jgi:preprotein translocase subunit SecF